MKSFHLVILTPKGVYLDGEVNELYLKTSIGYQGILANHDTLITGVEIAPGFIVKNNKKEYYAIFTGVLQVKKTVVELIVNNIESVNDIDIERAKNAQNRALERLKSKNPEIDRIRVELALKRALARISAINGDFL